MEELISKIHDDNEYISIIRDIINNETVRKMQDYRQHYDVSCFDHCLHVSYYSYKICKKFNLDYISMARAAILHDLFLYDWRKRIEGRKGLHAFTHPKTALENSLKLFNLNKKEQDIILKHMWPITIIPPRYIESYIITLVDKYCAMEESFSSIYEKYSKKTAFRYTYAFLCLLFIKL